jgi:hypothetical protein
MIIFKLKLYTDLFSKSIDWFDFKKYLLKQIIVSKSRDLISSIWLSYDWCKDEFIVSNENKRRDAELEF